MASRFSTPTRLDFSNVPLIQLPFEQLDQVLGQYQQQQDQFEKAANLGFEYLDQDAPYALQARQYQKELVSNLAEIAKQGDLDQYNSALKSSLGEIVKMRSLGGMVYAMQQRYAQGKKLQEEYSKFYEDNPRLATALSQRRMQSIGDLGYDFQTGNFNQINTSVTDFRDVSEKELNDWFNQNLDNIKDTMLQTGAYNRRDIQGFNSIHEFFDVIGRTPQQIESILSQVFPKEFVQSIYQREMVDRMYNPSLGPIDDRMVVDGKLNPNNPIGRLIKGYAEMGARQKVEVDRIKTTDNKALEDYKYKLTEQESLNSQVFALPEDAKVDFLNIDKNENVKKSVYRSASETGIRGGIRERQASANKPFKQYVNTPEFKENYPDHAAIYDRFKRQIDAMSDKDAYKFVKEKTEEKLKRQRISDVEYVPYDVKDRKARTEMIIGSVSGSGNDKTYLPGNITNMKITVLDRKGVSEELDFRTFMKKYNIPNLQTFIQQAVIKGNAKSNNPILPGGYMGYYIDKPNAKKLGKSKGIEFIASYGNETNAYYQPIRQLSSALTNGESGNVLLSELGLNDMVYAESKDIYLEDQLKNQLTSLEMQINSGQVTGERLDNYRKQIKEISEQLDRMTNPNNEGFAPSLNTYLGTEAVIRLSKDGEVLTDEYGNPLTIERVQEIYRAKLNQEK